MAKESVKELYIKSKLYRLASYILTAGGLVIFIMLYVRVTEGDVLVALRNPVLLLFCLFAFLPAAFMAYLSERFRHKALEKSGNKAKD